MIEIIGPGQSFGEALMFLEKPYIVFAYALADAMLLHVAKHCVFSELARDPAFSRKMLSGLSRRRRSSSRPARAWSPPGST